MSHEKIICPVFHAGPEERLILLLSRLNPSPDIIGDALRIINGADFDFDRLMSLARRNGVLPLLYRNLRDTDAIPEDTRADMENAYLSACSRNMKQVEETLRILDSLKAVNIEAIPLKGALASEIFFSDPGLYPSSDIDILVRPSDLEETEKILSEIGYTSCLGNETDMRAAHYHLIFSNGRHHIEVHWNLVKRYFKATPEFWWEDIREFDYRGMKLPMPSPENYILYAIFRLFDHGFMPLKFFVLIAALLDEFRDELEMQQLITRAEKLRMKRLTIFTLQLMRELCGAGQHGIKFEQKIAGYDLFKNLIISSLFAENPGIHIRMLAYILLLDTPVDVIRTLGRRVFPASEEIRLRYGISKGSPKTALYYFLNPLLLVFKKK